MKKMMFLMIALLAVGASAADYLFDCKEMTRQQEDWACSTSGVLVAQKKNVNATGTYQIPVAGKYTVWVMTETRNEGWRKGRLFLNDVSMGSFGDEKMADFQKPHFFWKKLLLPFEVKTANEVLKIRVNSINSMVRAARVLLTDKADFDPNKAEMPKTAEVMENAE